MDRPYPQDLVITMLGACLTPRTDRVWSGGLVDLLGDFGFSPGAARIALTRLLNRELLERGKAGRHTHYTLTDRTKSLLEEGDRRIFSLDPSPPPVDAWTIVWHSIPEEQRRQRGRFSRRLRFLGFGTLRDGTWVSPRNRRVEASKVIADLGVSDHCGVVIGRPSQALNFRRYVSRMWPLDDLSDRYRTYVEAFEPYRSRRRIGPKEAFHVRTLLVHSYREFPGLDPQLPDDFRPGPHLRTKAIEVFTTLYAQLEEPAVCYFREVTAGPA